MDVPYIVVDQLTPQQLRTWKTYFGDVDRPWYIEEGIWRRPRRRPPRAPPAGAAKATPAAG
ncbi:hypothetical protein LRS74_33110 [Streptomyces sp. LX-29]|uniref:hypothetical protein n=1 Tax=Streptomyces sp. LX-29 TaxID=2900152 RepID=UPI00240D379F|nr:hypothetical protein [Streptomyces sp. LX-29]WFB11335.1 hypothetical protein LRS74_33110 [Streptomyces sp. LX-29]